MNNTDYESIMCDANLIYKAYRKSIKSSKWKESGQRFALNYLSNIFKIKDDIINRDITCLRHNEFKLNERGKVRPITSLSLRDRIIRHVLIDEILLPKIEKYIIYENCASLKGRGVDKQREIFENHLRRYYQKYGTNEGYILFGDFSKFFDNIRHDIAKEDLLKLFDNDEFMDWILTSLFNEFKIDVSYMTDEEYSKCMTTIFDKNKYRQVPKELLTGKKWMHKSINIGDQFSQIIGTYYLNEMDTYIKYVRSQKFYGRYQDDWYIINSSYEELADIYEHIKEITAKYGVFINFRKTKITKLSNDFSFLQIVYRLTSTGKIIKRLKNISIYRMRRKLKKLSRLYYNDQIDYISIENMFKSWMCSFYKLIPKYQRQNLIKLHENLFHAIIEIDGKKMIFYKKEEV